MSRKITDKKTETEAQRNHLIRMRLLLEHAGFQNSIREIRENLRLPTGGLSFDKERAKEFSDWWVWFSEQTYKKVREAENTVKEIYDEQGHIKWARQLQALAQKLMKMVPAHQGKAADPTVSKYWKGLQKEYAELKGWFSSEIFETAYIHAAWKQNRKLLDDAPENYLYRQIDEVISQYHLPVSYQEPIRIYILYGKIRIPAENFLIYSKRSKVRRWKEAELIEDALGKSTHVRVDVFAPLTNQEIEDLGKRLRNEQSEVFPKGLLASIRPDTNIERLISLSRAGQKAKKTPGRPRMQRELVANSSYFTALKKNGLSDREIQKVIRQQELAGVDLGGKVNLEKTSGDVARKSRGKAADVRKARHKIKKLSKKVFPDV